MHLFDSKVESSGALKIGQIRQTVSDIAQNPLDSQGYTMIMSSKVKDFFELQEQLSSSFLWTFHKLLMPKLVCGILERTAWAHEED